MQFLLYICSGKNIVRNMKVKWIELVGEAHGDLGVRQYVRRIPGDDEWAAVCSKPEISKKVAKQRAEQPSAKRFAEKIAACKVILHDPEQRALWQARYDEAKREASRHGKKIQGRLCDFVRHEVFLS